MKELYWSIVFVAFCLFALVVLLMIRKEPKDSEKYKRERIAILILSLLGTVSLLIGTI